MPVSHTACCHALAVLFGVGALVCATPSLGAQQTYDVVLRGGTIYDGSGHDPFVGVGISARRISSTRAAWRSRRDS
jgi:hypothetical protein